MGNLCMGIGSGLWFGIGFGVVYDVLSTGFSLVRTSLILEKDFINMQFLVVQGIAFLACCFVRLASFQCFFMVCL